MQQKQNEKKKIGFILSVVRALLQWESYMLIYAWANLCDSEYLFVCAISKDFCDATEVIGCVTPTKNPL